MNFNPAAIPEEYRNNFKYCVQDGIKSIDMHFPEIRKQYGEEFEDRLAMTLYLEIIRMDIFK